MTDLDDGIGLDLPDEELFAREVADGTELAAALDALIAANPLTFDDPVWERRDGETDLQYRYFLMFRDSRRWHDVRPRVINEIRVALGLGASHGDSTGCRLYAIARKNEWQDRARAWDDAERRAHEATIRQQEVEHVSTHFKLLQLSGMISQAALGAAGKTYQAALIPGATPMRPRDAADAVRAAALMISTVHRPALPPEQRIDSHKVDIRHSGGQPVQQIIIGQRETEAFIAASSRIMDEDNLTPIQPDDVPLELWANAAARNDVVDVDPDVAFARRVVADGPGVHPAEDPVIEAALALVASTIHNNGDAA